MNERPEFVESWFEFLRKVEEWKAKPKLEDKRVNAVLFAVEVLGADRKKADNFVNRTVKWDIIKAYEHFGKIVSCEVCGKQGKGGYWCRPCIHARWCCECCILLGFPGYGAGVYELRETKCPNCGHEFKSFQGGSRTHLGLGVDLLRSSELKCPKCGKELKAEKKALDLC